MANSFYRADAADAAALIALERRVAVPRLYEARTSIGEILREIVANSFYLIRNEDGLVGTVSFRALDTNAVYIGNMAVVPSARRRGIARGALRFVFDRTSDAKRWELVTHPENEPAIGLYRSAGFRSVDVIDNCFGDGEPRIRLVRKRPIGS